MTSIKQNPDNSTLENPALPANGIVSTRANMRLPDFRNLGVCLRILVIVNLFALLAAILQTTSLVATLNQVAELSIFIQPVLLLDFLLLFAASPKLVKLRYKFGVAAVIGLTILATSLIYWFGSTIFVTEEMPGLTRSLLLSLIVTAIVLYYFYLRHRALTPAVAEARLQALQARIRPHFLFNSINAVLSLIRSQPARAETALEDMADLFRVLMADNRDLVPLAKEIALSRQYLALEKLRLDERLNIAWEIDSMPPDALIPPLVLQPLLENAVYHGIEPMPDGGTITVNITANRNQVHVLLSNPVPAQGGHQSGNKMALTNIRERLALHFDAEAALTSKTTDKQGAKIYQVHIVIPYHAAGAGRSI